MNKRKLTKLTALSAVFTLAFAGGILAGCGGHTHDISAVDRVEATCTTDGHTAYYKCSGCDEIFKDAEGKEKTTSEEVKLEALGHDPVHKPAKDADCTTDGNEDYWACSRCDAAFADENQTPYDGDPTIDALGHLNLDQNHTPYKAPTLEEDGDIEHYHCDRCEKDFADSYGDEELDNVVIAKPVELTNVTLTVKGYKDGEESPLSGELALAGQYEQTASGTATNGAATLAKVWSIKYKVVCGDYTGEITFDKNKTEYTLVLEYNYAISTGTSKSTNDPNILPANKSQIDFSRANDENHTITMRDFTWDTVDYTEAKLNIPDEVKNSKYATVSFTVKHLDSTMYGQSCADSGFNPLARFGVKMTAENGVFALIQDKSYAENDGSVDKIMACPFKSADDKLGIFDGYDGTNTQKLFAPVTSALHGDGLQVRVVRANTYIRMFVEVNGEWRELVNYQGPATCAANAETDIRLLINGHEWEFSNIEFSDAALVHQEIPATVGATYKPDHFLIGGQYFNADGTLTSEEALSLELKEITVSVEGYKDGDVADITTGTLVFTNERTGHSFEVALGANGSATTNVLMAEDDYRALYAYGIRIGDYYNNEVVFQKSQTTRKIMLEFDYAQSTGNGSKNSEVDLVRMNDEDHTIILRDSDVWDTKSYTEAKLNLSDEVKNSKYATVSFTLFHDGLGYQGTLNESGFNAVARFGVKMTERGGVGVTMLEKDRMEVFKLYKEQEDSSDPEAKTPEQPFWGYDNSGAAYNEYNSQIQLALHSVEGLNVRVVRAGMYIRMFVQVGNEWIELLSEHHGVARVDENAQTDIRLLILAHEWTFSQIDFGKTALVAEVPATTTAPGMHAHIKIGEQYFNPDGTLTTENALVIPQLVTIDSVALKLTDKNGKAVAADTAVVLKNADVGTVNATVGANGTVTLENKIYADYAYTVTVNGYAFSYEVTFGNEEEYAVRLDEEVDWKYSTTSSLTVERGDYPAHWDGTFAVNQSDSDKIQIDARYPVSSSVVVDTSTVLENAEFYTLFFNLKTVFEGGWKDKIGIRLTDATGDGVCGFWFMLKDNIITSELRGKINLDENKGSEKACIVTRAMFEAGVDMKVERQGKQATLYARINGKWEEVNTVTLEGEHAKIAFASSAGTQVYTNVAVAVYPPEKLDSVTLTLTDVAGQPVPNGTKITLESVKGTIEATVGENGTVTLTGDTAVWDKCTYSVRVNGSMNERYIIFGGAEAELTNVYLPADWSYSDAEKLTVVEGEKAGSGGAWDTGSFSIENSTVDKIQIDAVYAVSKEVVLDTGSALTGTDVYTLNFNLKTTFQGGWQDKFGIRLTDATGDNICGFFLFFKGDEGMRIAGLHGKIKLDGNGEAEKSCIVTKDMFEAGVDMRIERIGNVATLYAKIGGEWKAVNTITLSGNAKIAFAASAGAYTYSNIAVSAVKELESVTLTLTDKSGAVIAQGTEVTLKNAYSAVKTTVGENGVVTLTGESAVYSALGYTLALGEGYVGNYFVIFNGATAAISGFEKQSVSADMTLNDISTSNGNVVFDLDSGELNGKEILAFQRYGENNMFEKDDGNLLGDTGLLGLTGRYGNDFNGDTESIKFTANSTTNASCGFLGQSNPAGGSVTVKVNKNCTQLVFFTGTYMGGNFTFDLLQCGQSIATHTYHGATDGGTRGKMLVVDLDTSALAEGEEVEFTFTISGEHLEFAAFVVLGAAVEA